MQEKPLLNARESKEKTPHPNLLDIVKINGRWAQVIGSGNYVKYLEKKEIEEINWNDYRLIKNWDGLPVRLVKNTSAFDQAELENIHWGPEQKEQPKLKEEVCVFGEFEKNQQANS